MATAVSLVSSTFTTKSAARRLIVGGGLEVNGQKVVDPGQVIDNKGNIRMKIGKKEFAIVTF
jgi:tyrosyl-tRNA synthetase